MTHDSRSNREPLSRDREGAVTARERSAAPGPKIVTETAVEPRSAAEQTGQSNCGTRRCSLRAGCPLLFNYKYFFASSPSKGNSNISPRNAL